MGFSTNIIKLTTRLFLHTNSFPLFNTLSVDELNYTGPFHGTPTNRWLNSGVLAVAIISLFENTFFRGCCNLLLVWYRVQTTFFTAQFSDLMFSCTVQGFIVVLVF